MSYALWEACPMHVASLRLRLAAALVDAAVFGGGMAVVIGMGIAGALAYARVRGDGEDQATDADEPSEIAPTARRLRQSPELRAAVWGASAGLAVASRNWRSPGSRVVGLRRVDARSGGIVTVRSALIGVLFDQARQAAGRSLFRSRVQRRRDRLSALGPQLAAVQRTHGAREARQRAMTEFYEANDVKVSTGCAWQLAGPIVSQLLLVPGSRGGRTIRDRVTGTSVIAGVHS